MQQVAHHRFLYDRGGSYYFRRAVPPRARHLFGGKSEVLVSLRTRNLSEARLKAARHLAEFEQKLAALADRPLHGAASPFTATRAEMEAGVRSWLMARVESLTPTFGRRDLTDPTERQGDLHRLETAVRRGFTAGKVPLDTGWTAEEIARANGWVIDRAAPEWAVLCDLTGRGQIEFAKRAADQLTNEEGRAYNHALFGPDQYAADSAAPSGSRLTFKQAVDEFLRNPDLSANAQTRSHYRAQLETMAEALGPTKKVASITRTDCRRLRDEVILKLPNYRKTKFPGLSVMQAVAAAEAGGHPLIHPKTQNQMVDILHALFAWAKKYEHRHDNPAEDLRVAVPKKKSRRPFTRDELARIFNAPIYTGCVDDEDGFAKQGSARPRRARFWVPLIGLFTGMRIREICQLRAGDVIQSDDVWVIHVRADESVGTRLKTASSERRVPMHPELVRAGLPELVCQMKAADWLFPELQAKRDGADAMSKWFGRFLATVGIVEEGAVFHSFRHTFRDALREAELLKAYLTEVARVKATGAGTAETSYYGALQGALNLLGEELRPKVYCLQQLSSGGVFPDFGLFSAAQMGKATSSPGWTVFPERGVVEADGVATAAINARRWRKPPRARFSDIQCVV